MSKITIKNIFVKARKLKIGISIALSIISLICAFFVPWTFLPITAVFLLLGHNLSMQEKYSKAKPEDRAYQIEHITSITAYLAVFLGLVFPIFNDVVSFYLGLIIIYFAFGQIGISLYFAFKNKRGALKILWLIFAAIFMIMQIIYIFAFGASLILVLLGSYGGNDGGCKICGQEIFAGGFCQKHFNGWAAG